MMDQKRLERLCKLLKREKDPDNAAALRWVIFMLEQFLK